MTDALQGRLQGTVPNSDGSSNILGDGFFASGPRPGAGVLRARDIRGFDQYKKLRGLADESTPPSGLRVGTTLGAAWRKMIAAPEDQLWATVDELRHLKRDSCPVGSPFVAPPSPAVQLTPASDQQLYSEFLTYWEAAACPMVNAFINFTPQ